jgi:hypothetical protein
MSRSSYVFQTALKSAIKAGLVVSSFGFGSWYVLKTGEPKFLFSPFMKMVCYAQQPFTGLSVRFDRVEGNLENGQLDFENLRMVWQKERQIPQKFDMDMFYKRFMIDYGAANADLLLRDTEVFLKNLDSEDVRKTFVVNRLETVGARGHTTILIRNPDTPIINVSFKEFSITDTEVTFGDAWNREEPLIFPPIRVDWMRMENFRMQKMLHSFLLRSEGRGTIGGAPYELIKGRKVTATTPVEFMMSFLRPPLSWIQMGTSVVDIKIDPVPNKTSSMVSVVLTTKGETGDLKDLDLKGLGDFGLAASSVVQVLNGEFVVTAQQEISADPALEDEFLEEIGTKFSTYILVQAGKKIKDKWFS